MREAGDIDRLLANGQLWPIAYRDGDFLRIISLHPDHDSAYGR